MLNYPAFIFLWFVILWLNLLIVFGVGVIIKIYRPDAFKRSNKVNRMFLEMLDQLAKEDWAWEFNKWNSAATHTDTGIKVFRKGGAGAVMMPDGQEVIFDKATKGDRICSRIFKIGKKLESARKQKTEIERDLARLKAMNEAYKRMEAKYMHEGKVK